MDSDQNINIPKLSVVILCYRSGPSIMKFVEETIAVLEKEIVDVEYVLVANYLEGSNDQTLQHVNAVAAIHPKCTVLNKPKKGMMGWDMRQGLKAAKGQNICVIDGDGQFPISSIVDCYQELSGKNLDLVKTFRSTREDGIYRKTISTMYNVLFSIMFPGLRSKDINSKPKLLTRQAYERMTLTSDDWFIDAEIMLNVRDLGLKYTEIPVQFNELKGRKSFVKVGAILEFMKNMIRYRLR